MAQEQEIIKPIQSIDFGDENVDVYEHDGQIFLKGEDLGCMLELADPRNGVHNIFVRHEDELKPHSVTLKLIASDGKAYETRVYSETGAYLVAMFARSSKAKEVRQWLAELPKKVREFGKTVQEDIQQALEEAREQGRLQALKEFTSEIDEDKDLWESIQGITTLDKCTDLPVSPRPHFKAARAAYELSQLNLFPEVLDRLLLYWILDREDEDTSRALSMRIEEVEIVFSLFQVLGFPRLPNLLPNGLPWQEPLPRIPREKADLEKVEQRLRNLILKITNFVDGCPKIDQAFAILHEVAPPWMIVTTQKVHLTKDLILALNLKTRTMADLARALGWGVSYLNGSGSGFRTISLSRQEFYDRYFKGMRALPFSVPGTESLTPGDAMADWIRKTWEGFDQKHRAWLERQFMKTFPEAKGALGNYY